LGKKSLIQFSDHDRVSHLKKMTKGSTAAGKPADLAGLSKNILGNLAEEIQNMNVDVTFF
jgi:hypothetical protein